MFKKAVIIGGGAFGTAMASLLSKNFEKVIIKVRSKDVYDLIKKGENSIYLKGQKLDSNIDSALEWEELDQALDGNPPDVIVSALPTSTILEYYTENINQFLPYFEQGVPFVSLSKGIDSVSLELPDDIFFKIFKGFEDNFIFLSGPGFAKEILEQQITLVTIAGISDEHLKKVSSMFASHYFKTFLSKDIKGVLLGGALKNVLAISGGVIEGLGFNHNTRAAMITRGVAEILRFGEIYGANRDTFYGLSGVGDIILTATGGLSRNKTFGLEIAKGRKAQEIIDSQRSVVEGYKTTLAAYKLSEKYSIKARLFNGVYRVLYNNEDPMEVIGELMRTPVQFEI